MDGPPFHSLCLQCNQSILRPLHRPLSRISTRRKIVETLAANDVDQLPKYGSTGVAVLSLSAVVLLLAYICFDSSLVINVRQFFKIFGLLRSSFATYKALNKG